jgi:ribosomal-protein-alanine N-acetyltransferase
MKSAPEIVTKRLSLRAFSREDAPDVFAYASNPNVLRYTTGQTHRTIADAEKFVEAKLDSPPGKFSWAIRLKKESSVIGAIEFGTNDGKTWRIDYALGEEHWNKGLMTEAAKAVLKWAFRAHPDMQTVTSSAMTVNRASTRVMEKCGMEFETRVREKWDKFDEPVDLAVYSISRGKWETQQRHPQQGG